MLVRKSILWMVNVYYGVHKRLKPVTVLSQMNQISTTASCFSVSTKYFKDDQTEERDHLQLLQDSVLSKLILKKWNGGCGVLLSNQERDPWYSVVNTGRNFCVL